MVISHKIDFMEDGNVAQLDKLTVSGFKSIRTLDDFSLKQLNLLIGANGAGKSNFLEIFKFLRAIMQLPLPGFRETNLQKYVLDYGSASDFLYEGFQTTDYISFQAIFGQNGYHIVLRPTQDGLLRIDQEQTYYVGTDVWSSLYGSNGIIPELLREKDYRGVSGPHGVPFYIYESISKWQMYHFHDTGRLSPIKSFQKVEDNAYLRFDGSNIASYLYKLKISKRTLGCYRKIVETIQLVAPFFEDFILNPTEAGTIRLTWHQKGSDYPMKPQSLSDGTLRFICLATVLLQPRQPETILIDEPELGLHPYAISLLAELIKGRSVDTQIIISTQSPELIDCFEPDDVIVCDRKEGQSTFTRLDKKDLDLWLSDYNLGDLWKNNILSGGPLHE